MTTKTKNPSFLYTKSVDGVFTEAIRNAFLLEKKNKVPKGTTTKISAYKGKASTFGRYFQQEYNDALEILNLANQALTSKKS